jgi:hypothetical protein
MSMRGFPIGKGEVWHDERQKRWLLIFVIAAFMPALGLFLFAMGLIPQSWRANWLLGPSSVFLSLGVAFCALKRWKNMFKRLVVGLGAGLSGGLAAGTSHWLISQFFLAPASAPLQLPGSIFLVALTTSALWGAAYALVAGPARWYYGTAYGALLWLTVALSAGLPWMQLPPAWGAAGQLGPILALLYGTTLGLLNSRFQPALFANAKIVFLRDYVAQRQKRH